MPILIIICDNEHSIIFDLLNIENNRSVNAVDTGCIVNNAKKC